MAEDDEQNPFGGGFIAATTFVVLIVVLGIAVVVSANRDDGEAAAAATTPSVTVSRAPRTSAKDTSASLCGLAGKKLSGTLTVAPRATWKYQGTTGYPTSSSIGPGRTGKRGVRTCFQHSPTGALFMAANAFAQVQDRDTALVWGREAMAQGRYRDQIIAAAAESAKTPQNGSDDVRTSLVGFRLLDYQGATARVDLAVRNVINGQRVIGSYVYELVWQDGDWRISSDVASPLDFAVIPDTAGYVPWGA